MFFLALAKEEEGKGIIYNHEEPDIAVLGNEQDGREGETGSDTESNKKIHYCIFCARVGCCGSRSNWSYCGGWGCWGMDQQFCGGPNPGAKPCSKPKLFCQPPILQLHWKLRTRLLVKVIVWMTTGIFLTILSVSATTVEMNFLVAALLMGMQIHSLDIFIP
jgi:hypothetical protein